MRYTIRKTRRAKRICLTVREDATVVVTAPPRVSARIIASFVTRQQQWIADAQKRMRERQAAAPPKPWKGTAAEYAEQKAAALQLVQQHLTRLNVRYGLQWKQVKIRNQRLRWGSCSRSGNLNFNYRIVFLPNDLQEYLVVHELCHLAHMNHSPKFWTMVARTVPQYRTFRRRLRGLRI